MKMSAGRVGVFLLLSALFVFSASRLTAQTASTGALTGDFSNGSDPKGLQFLTKLSDFSARREALYGETIIILSGSVSTLGRSREFSGARFSAIDFMTADLETISQTNVCHSSCCFWQRQRVLLRR